MIWQCEFGVQVRRLVVVVTLRHTGLAFFILFYSLRVSLELSHICFTREPGFCPVKNIEIHRNTESVEKR